MATLAGFQSDLSTLQGLQDLLTPKYLPQLEGADIDGASIPAGAIGGDYFDARVARSGALFMCMADVMGKGLRAALLSLSLRSAFRSVLCYEERHCGIMNVLNQVVGEELRRAGAFATFCLLSFEPGARSLACSNAGHCPPLIYTNGHATYFGGAGQALGLSENCPAPVAETARLAPGEVVVLYTDGLVEARNPPGEKFGKERLQHAVEESVALRATEIREAILSRLFSFTDGQEQRDDITLAVLKIKVEEGGARLGGSERAT
ncbi:MAG: PP2C family protein-serine/threonine phosphatase [Bacillota bacterium]